MGGAFSLRDYVAGLGAHVPRVTKTIRFGLMAFGVGLVATAVWVVSTKRLYRSESVVAYDRGAQATTLGRDAEAPRVLWSRLQDMVMSRPRIEALIKDMNLYPKIVDQRGQAEAIDEMRKRLRVVHNEGYTYRFWYDGETRELAKDVLDRLLGSIVKEDTQRRVREAEEAKRFLDAERKQADADLKTKEGSLTTFLTKHPQLAGETGGAAAGALLRAERVGSVSGSEIASLQLQAAQIEADIAAATRSRPTAPRTASGVLVDPKLAAARTRAEVELQSAQAELSDKQARLTNEHPDVRRALRRVSDAEAAMRRAEAAVAAWVPPAATAEAPPVLDDGDNTKARVTALRSALSAVRSQISAARGRSTPKAETDRPVSSVVAIETEWTKLNREVAEARERQTQLEGKQFQAQLAATLAAEGQGGRLVIADPPFKPLRPVAGERFKVGLVGLGGSVVLGLLVIALLAAFDDRLYGPRDIEGVLDPGIIVVIPKPVRPRLTSKGG
jgi:hypothetical protein